MKIVPIKNYETLYNITDTGKIFSLRTNREIKTTKLNKYGIRTVALINTNKSIQTHTVSALMLKSFFKLSSKVKVHYKDGNKQNIALSNLQNIAKQTSRIIQKDINNKIIKVWDSAEEAAASLNVTPRSVLNACNKTFKGFIWELK
jgi:hypothetical protein